MTVLRILGFRRTVSDLDRALDFYVGALGFVLAEPQGPPAKARLMLGAQWLELVVATGMADRTEGSVASSDFQHFALVVEDIDAALRRLRHHAPRAISTGAEAVRLPASSGGVLAFKFRDPDGHPLELIQGSPARIDHSAVSVGNLAGSLAFYVDTLGLQPGTRQINQGPEQARLDGVACAVVEVLALDPVLNATPHLELLAYGQPSPTAQAMQDEHRDQVIYLVADLARIQSRLGLEGRQAQRLCVHDPDGHGVVLVPA